MCVCKGTFYESIVLKKREELLQISVRAAILSPTLESFEYALCVCVIQRGKSSTKKKRERGDE